MLDGFLPYVSTSPARVGSKHRQAIVIGVAALILVAVTTWLAWPKDPKPLAATRPPIILPPPGTVSQRPSTFGSPRPSTADTQVAAPAAQTTTEPSGSSRLPST